MSEKGVFAIDRGIFDHPLFETKEPFSKREAWVWMLAEAAWKPRKRVVSGKVVELQRGQFAHSIRFMADAWGWPKSTVDRFLGRLKTETMIGTDTETGQLVITVCNYDEYQKVALPKRDSSGTHDGTVAGQQRDKLESIENIEVVKEPNGSLSETDVSDVPKSRKRQTYPEPYQQAWSLYPTDPNMSKAKTFDAWKKLDAGDRQLLIQSIPAFKAYCRKNPEYRPVHMVRYITDRRFEGHAGEISGASDADWSKRLSAARLKKLWTTAEWGPMPGVLGCGVPRHLIEQGDGVGWKEWTTAAA